jgi:hypothetical protein
LRSNTSSCFKDGLALLWYAFYLSVYAIEWFAIQWLGFVRFTQKHRIISKIIVEIKDQKQMGVEKFLNKTVRTMQN